MEASAGTQTHRPKPITAGEVFQPTHQWTIDDESPSHHIVNRREVTVLMESEEPGMPARGDRAVALTFRVGHRNGKAKRSGKAQQRANHTGERRKARGKGAWAEHLSGGRVLHVISHFGKQQANRSDTFVLQNLILNFVLESSRQHD